MAKIHLIMGNRYRIKFVSDRKLGADHDGECDEPIFDVNEIRINKNLSGKRLLEVIIHEATHGARFHGLSEKFVTQFASDLADILVYFGYEKVEHAKSQKAATTPSRVRLGKSRTRRYRDSNSG